MIHVGGMVHDRRHDTCRSASLLVKDSPSSVEGNLFKV